MTPKQILEWTLDKAILAAALLWVSAEFVFDFCVLLPLQIALEFISGIIITVFDLDKEEGKEE